MPKFLFPYSVETFTAIPTTDPDEAKVHHIFGQFLNFRR